MDEATRLAIEFHNLLAIVRKRRGLSQRAVSRSLNRGSNYVRQQRADARVDKTGSILEILKMSPRALADLLEEESRHDQILDGFGPADEPERAEALEAFSRLEELVPWIPTGQSHELDAESWQRIEDLERSRFTQPEKTDDECRRMVEACLATEEPTRDEAARAIGALGVWSTIRRTSNDLGSARDGLCLALRCARQLRGRRLEARLLQRACYVLRDVGRYRAATILARRAGEHYQLLGDHEYFGHVSIDQGHIAFWEDRFLDAEQLMLFGVGLLRSLHTWRSKASAYQVVAKCRSLAGEQQASLHYLELASAAAEAEDKEQWALIRWCLGGVQWKLGAYEAAEAAYVESLGPLIECGRVASVVAVAIDLAVVLTARRKRDQVKKLAAHLEPYLRRLPERDSFRGNLEEAYLCLRESATIETLLALQERLRQEKRGGSKPPRTSTRKSRDSRR